jgi:hypothetical protein
MSNQEQKTSPETHSAEDEATIKQEKDVNETSKRMGKKHHLLKLFLGIFIVVLLSLVGVAGWLGFVPGLSDILGAHTPQDLGVRWSDTDFISYRVKTDSTFKDFAEAPDNPERPGKKSVFADPKTVENLSLTQEEITAAINSLGWAWLPAENVQVRLTKDTVEISGNIKLAHAKEFVNFIGGVGYSSSDVTKAVDWGTKFVEGGAFYAKGGASVKDDQLTLNLQSIRIGRFSAPLDIATTVIYTGGSNGINNTQNLEIKSATVTDGALSFSGTYPTTVYVRH